MRRIGTSSPPVARPLLGGGKKIVDPTRKNRPIDGNANVFVGDFAGHWSSRRAEQIGSLRCKDCKQVRAMDLDWHGDMSGPIPLSPGLGIFRCRQCTAEHWAGISFEYKRDEKGVAKGTARVILFGHAVSIATSNTHKAVAYYLDQAAKSKAGGARSAAAAMFRAALEHLLFDQKFEKGMLNSKIEALEAAIAAGTAPAWARDLDTAELKALKDLGNGSIHTNGGDVTLQAAIDDSVLEYVELVFDHMLDKIYEEPARQRARLASIAKAAAAVSPPKKPTP